MKYIVTTSATVTKHYEVDAANEKDAVAKSVDQAPVHEEEVNEELVSVTLAPSRSEKHGD